MRDRLVEGMTRLGARFSEAAARAVSYTRDGVTLTGIAATEGRQLFRTSAPNGRSIIVRSERDYLIDTTALDFGAGATDPHVGDRITDGTETYEVYRPVRDEEPCFRRLPEGKFRIHTRRA